MSANYEIKLTPTQWDVIYKQLREEYPLSVLAIREKTKEHLGFTIRSKTNLSEDEIKEFFGEGYYYAMKLVILDFFDEQMQTFFKLRYL